MRKAIIIAALAALPVIAQTPTPAPTPAPAPAPAPPQLRLPRPSPKQTVTQTVGITDVTVIYSRPGVKGRKIWGALVPYGQVWRTGANEATILKFSNDVTVGGKSVPAGSYSLQTIPTATNDWTIILNGVADQWGAFKYDETKDVVRFPAKAQSAPFTEWFTIDFSDVSPETATLTLRWENLAVPFQIGIGTKARVMASLREALAAAKPDDYQIRTRAADFAFNNDMPSEAQEWVNQSLAIKQSMSALWLKARMQAKAGNKDEAKKTVAAALALAGPNDTDFAGEIKRLSALW